MSKLEKLAASDYLGIVATQDDVDDCLAELTDEVWTLSSIVEELNSKGLNVRNACNLVDAIERLQPFATSLNNAMAALEEE